MVDQIVVRVGRVVDTAVYTASQVFNETRINFPVDWGQLMFGEDTDGRLRTLGKGGHFELQVRPKRIHNQGRLEKV